MQVKMDVNNYNNRSNSSVTFKQILRNDIPAKAIKDNNYLLLISAPSGTGKDAVMNKIIDKFNKIVTHTTRPKREGEINGKSYFFTTVEEFVKGIKNNEFAEYIEGFSGKYYGTKKETIKKALNGEKPGLLIVDIEGAKNIKNNLKEDSDINVVSIFFKPPSLDVLKSRLLKRGTEKPEAIAERLGRATYEMQQAKYYDAEIQVNDVESSLQDLDKLLHLNIQI